MIETNMERIRAKAAAEAMAEGVLLGKLEGKLEGKIEGESMLLERLIAKRFGPVTDDTRTRLRTATSDQLEAWAERILDARSVAEVFSDH